MHVEADPLGDLPVRFWDSYMLFEQAQKHFDAQQYGEAAVIYGRILEEVPESELAAPAAFNLALSLEEMGRYAQAAEGYESLLASHPGAVETAEVLFRLGRCREQTGEWEEAARIFGDAVGQWPLTQVEAVTAQARFGVALYMLDRAEESLETLRDALEEYRDLKSKRIRLPGNPIARAYFTLGEIYFERFTRVSLEVPPDDLEVALEGKGRLLLLARAQYVQAIRLVVPEWVTASLYRIGKGYEMFYRAVLSAPDPPDLLESERERYRRELEATISPVLQKAMAAHRRNVQTAAEMGVENQWVTASRLKLAELEAD